MGPRADGGGSAIAGPWRRVALGQLRDAALAVAAAAAVLAVVFALFTARIIGPSMEPTVNNGDALLVDRLGPRLQAPARGDVVVVAEPNGVAVVKRVIGVPGDAVEIDGAHVGPGGGSPHPAVMIQPGAHGPWHRLDEPYVAAGWVRAEFCCAADGRAVTSIPTPLTLPPGEFFLLGDNRVVSIDSRDFGLVPRERILARAVVRYWPLDRASVLRS
jgi:signal peptidase I